MKLILVSFVIGIALYLLAYGVLSSGVYGFGRVLGGGAALGVIVYLFLFFAIKIHRRNC
jgi:hypothetical protein